MKQKAQEKNNKALEQEEYRRLFDENEQRYMDNQFAYKKRFEDIDKKMTLKNIEFYDIINENELKRAEDAKKISQADKKSFFDYYNDRDKQKLQRTEEMKEDSYKDMKLKIDQNYRNINEMNRKRREDAENSVQELQKYLDDEKNKRIREKMIQQQYKGILETQVKIK